MIVNLSFRDGQSDCAGRPPLAFYLPQQSSLDDASSFHLQLCLCPSHAVSAAQQRHRLLQTLVLSWKLEKPVRFIVVSTKSSSSVEFQTYWYNARAPGLMKYYLKLYNSVAIEEPIK